MSRVSKFNKRSHACRPAVVGTCRGEVDLSLSAPSPVVAGSRHRCLLPATPPLVLAVLELVTPRRFTQAVFRALRATREGKKGEKGLYRRATNILFPLLLPVLTDERRGRTVQAADRHVGRSVSDAWLAVRGAEARGKGKESAPSSPHQAGKRYCCSASSAKRQVGQHESEDERR